MRKTLGALTILALALAQPACGRPPPSYALTSVQVTDDAAWVTMVQTRNPSDVRFFVGACDRSGRRVVTSGCTWSEVNPPSESDLSASQRAASSAPPTTTPSPADPLRQRVRTDAAGDHDCPIYQISVDADHSSEQGTAAFWLTVCGTQRFYRFDPESDRFLEATP